MVEGQEEIIAHERGAAPTAELVRAVTDALEGDNKEKVRVLVAEVHGPDLADLIELLGPQERVGLIQTLGSDFDYKVLTEVDEKVRDQISAALPRDVLAKAVSDLDSDDAAYVIGGLTESEQKEILDRLPQSERAALQRNLLYPEEA